MSDCYEDLEEDPPPGIMELTALTTVLAASFTTLTALLAMRRGALGRLALERFRELERLRELAAFLAAAPRFTDFARRFAPPPFDATLRRALDLPVLRFDFPREEDFFLVAITIHLLNRIG